RRPRRSTDPRAWDGVAGRGSARGAWVDPWRRRRAGVGPIAVRTAVWRDGDGSADLRRRLAAAVDRRAGGGRDSGPPRSAHKSDGCLAIRMTYFLGPIVSLLTTLFTPSTSF